MTSIYSGEGNVGAAKHLEVAFFTLSVFPLFFSSPHVIVFCINPFTSLRASRRLVCSFFSFVTPLFQKASLILKQRETKKRETRRVEVK